MKDLTGQRFGRLTAIKPTDERRNSCVVWECQCDCGNITYVSAGHLRAARISSCGCAKEKKPMDLTGQRFGRLTAVKATDERYFGSFVWECKCDCGNITYVPASRLRNGDQISCGCARGSKGADLTGERFGMLTAVKPTDKRDNRSVVWECKCDCGNTVFIKATSLRAGYTQSCGCSRSTRGRKARDKSDG